MSCSGQISGRYILLTRDVHADRNHIRSALTCENGAPERLCGRHGEPRVNVHTRRISLLQWRCTGQTGHSGPSGGPLLAPRATIGNAGQVAHSVEFLFDPVGEAAIRIVWESLADAGLPSQARHRVATNRPHVTAVAARHLDKTADAALTEATSRVLPVPVVLGAPLVFGRPPRYVVARSVVPTDELLAAHARVFRELDRRATQSSEGVDFYPHSAPGRWTPHVTLARRVHPDRLAAVLAVIADSDPEPATQIVGLRRWDGDARTEHLLGPEDS